MRAVVQRVREAAVEVDGQVVGAIGPGLLVLLGVRNGDTEAEARWLADKCVNLRVFEDEAGKFNRSALDVRGEILVVSQFTLYGDASRGRRPSFIDAAPPPVSEPLYERFAAFVAESGLRVARGVFGAHMNVRLANDGPVTLILDKNGGEP